MTWFLPSVLFGILISLALFWLMQAMLMHNKGDFKASNNLQRIEFVRLKRESKTQKIERKKPKPPPPKKRPPPLKAVSQKTVVKNNMPSINMPNINIPLLGARFKGSVMQGIKAGQSNQPIGFSNNVIPLVKIPPRYPKRASSRRIEGWVKIEFTITETGAVIDAIVVSAKPSGIFDRAALRAIAKWKFKAKVVDGESVKQRAVQLMEFNLSP